MIDSSRRRDCGDKATTDSTKARLQALTPGDGVTAASAFFIAPYAGEYAEEAEVVFGADGRVGYRDERPEDRSVEGVLLSRWSGTQTGPQRWGEHHARRQFHVMEAPLGCAGCAGPPHRDERGILWILHTSGMRLTGHLMGPVLVTTPPLCLRDASKAMRGCDVLQGGAVALRVTEAEVVGVRGMVYSPTETPEPGIVRFDDPRIRRVVADGLVREISHAEVDTTTLPILTDCSTPVGSRAGEARSAAH
ncbi:hypothetical protein ACFVQ4_15025 [Streptomyces laurentii]|uniref:hypothetical protein n=1 Tax=Streptomyces laurentii TaxID=39478 RepID=UPI00369FCC1A